MYREGTASQSVYAVDYPELEWNKLTPEQVEEYKERWHKATNDAMCTYLVVRSIPDALFGEGGPKVVYQHTIDNRPWALEVSVEAILHPDTEFNRVRDAMLTRLRIAYGPMTRYKVVRRGTLELLEEGVI